MSDTVLISTHDLPVAGPLREAFEGAGYGVVLVSEPPDLRRAPGEPVLLVVTAMEAPGAERLARVGEERGLPVFGIFRDPSGEGWRRVSRRVGLAEAFPGKVDAGDILVLGRRVVERRRLQEITGIVGETDAMREVLERVVQIAPVNSTVLVTGESGTGKELVARGLHALSPRKHRAFIAVNVAALPDTLLESELFGHEKGAFTGAVDARRGLFELADRGTIFLDEIGEMPLSTQTKLLRVLEQREFLRVGGEKPIRVDVRIITATNQDLRQLLVLGDFRRDLYFRLNVLRIELPPLRERRDDIPLLVHGFVREVSARHDRPFVGISDEAMRILQEYHWPGNVRELRNLVESMVVLAPGRIIGPEDIPEDVRAPGGGRSLLPAVIPRRGGRGGEGGGVRPELEFVFRTLVELRVDLDQLRQQFEAYRNDVEAGREIGVWRAGPLGPAERLGAWPPSVRLVESEASPVGSGGLLAGGTPQPRGGEEEERVGKEEGVVVFRPGMTMDDLERQAILAALREVDGNRRRAAELLGIGERTLYRKIQKFELDA
jgi:DNA-binding NtrC family response regulator